MKTKEQELCELLDFVFESAQEPDWAHVLELAYRSQNYLWVTNELMKLLWLCAQDQAAFDEAIWVLLNATE